MCPDRRFWWSPASRTALESPRFDHSDGTWRADSLRKIRTLLPTRRPSDVRHLVLVIRTLSTLRSAFAVHAVFPGGIAPRVAIRIRSPRAAQRTIAPESIVARPFVVRARHGGGGEHCQSRHSCAHDRTMTRSVRFAMPFRDPPVAATPRPYAP